MISVSSSPASSSALTAQSLEPVSDFVSPSLSAPPLLAHALSVSLLKINIKGCLDGSVGWAADFSQVTISRSVSSSPASGSVLTAQSLEPVSDFVSPSLSAPPLFMLCLSLSQK